MASQNTKTTDLLDLLSSLSRYRMQQESWVNPEAVEDRHLREMFEERRRRRELRAQSLEAQPQPQEPAPSLAPPEPSPADNADEG